MFVELFQNPFLHLLRWSYGFYSSLCQYVILHDLFAYIEEYLHPWDKSYLIVEYDPFKILLDSTFSFINLFFCCFLHLYFIHFCSLWVLSCSWFLISQHLRPTGLWSQLLWGLSLPVSDSQVGVPDIGLRTLTSVGEPLWYNFFSACGWFFFSPSRYMGFDYIARASLLPSSGGFFFGCRLTFLVGLILFVNGCWTASCDYGVFTTGGELNPSTPPSCLSPSTTIWRS